MELGTGAQPGPGAAAGIDIGRYGTAAAGVEENA
jgi:hypothetical protein